MGRTVLQAVGTHRQHLGQVIHLFNHIVYTLAGEQGELYLLEFFHNHRNNPCAQNEPPSGCVRYLCHQDDSEQRQEEHVDYLCGKI